MGQHLQRHLTVCQGGRQGLPGMELCRTCDGMALFIHEPCISALEHAMGIQGLQSSCQLLEFLLTRRQQADLAKAGPILQSLQLVAGMQTG